MARYIDSFQNYPFGTIKAKFPLAQEAIWKALEALTPSRLQFEINCHKEDEWEFSYEDLDRDTFNLIGAVLSDMLEDPKLIITNHDLWLGWARFKELLYLQQLIKQGIITEEIGEDGTIHYVSPESPVPKPKRPTVFSGKVRRGGVCI